MGADSAESAHSRDNGDSALSGVAPEDGVRIGGDEEDEEVVAVNAAEDRFVRPCPQSLPVFVGRGVESFEHESPGSFIVHGVGAATSASRGGGDSQNKYASTTEEESNIILFQQHQ